jgi:hypothetical protein
VGTSEYDYFAYSPTAWGADATEYPLGALASPLVAINSHDEAMSMGHGHLNSPATTEYRGGAGPRPRRGHPRGCARRSPVAGQ